MKQAIKLSHDTSPGFDTVHYQLLKHLTDDSLLLLLYVFITFQLVDAGFSDFIEDGYCYSYRCTVIGAQSTELVWILDFKQILLLLLLLLYLFQAG